MADYSDNKIANGSTTYVAELNAFMDEVEVDVTAVEATAAGAVQESDTSTANMGFVIDDDTMLTATPTVLPSAESVKAYVDTNISSALSSAMSYMGGYDAATNTPNLDATPIATAIGDFYSVTVAGTFFTTPVEVGDSIIAEIVNATLEADWTILNRNLGDIGSTAAGAGASLIGINDSGNQFTSTTVENALQEVGKNAVQLLQNKVLLNANMSGGMSGTAIDSSVSTSTSKVPTSSAVKAYVDSLNLSSFHYINFQGNLTVLGRSASGIVPTNPSSGRYLVTHNLGYGNNAGYSATTDSGYVVAILTMSTNSIELETRGVSTGVITNLPPGSKIEVVINYFV